MEVIAFVGPSGTGKSHRALVVAHENKVDCIIDDGILIYQNRIIAGSSAKKEKSRLKAVRRAIFQDKHQVEAVQIALDKIKPKKLLILGTSDNMVSKIAIALNISLPNRYIRIEDVATKKEIETARNTRIREGKHIIPVPTMELRPHFKGYLIDPLRSILRLNRGGKAANSVYEKSVVRPIFSYYGKLTFADKVIEHLIKYSTTKVQGVVSLQIIKIKKSKKGTNGLLLELATTVEAGYKIRSLMSILQKTISKEIEFGTGMFVERMQITIKDIV